MSQNKPDMHQISRWTMQTRVKAAAILLSIVVAAGISTAAWLTSFPVRGRAAGCPMHRPSFPPDSPISHNCCQSSHDTAVLQKAANPKPDVATFALVSSDQKPIPQDVFALIPDETDLPGLPPAKLQLRV
jgi:hypothetical protein